MLWLEHQLDMDLLGEVKWHKGGRYIQSVKPTLKTFSSEDPENRKIEQEKLKSLEEKSYEKGNHCLDTCKEKKAVMKKIQSQLCEEKFFCLSDLNPMSH